MRAWGFVGIALKRIVSKPGLSLLLILSFSLTIGVMVCVPVFSDAVGKRMVQEEISLRAQAQNSPPFPVRFVAMPRSNGTLTMDEADFAESWFSNMLVRVVGVPIKSLYREDVSSTFYLQTMPGDTRYVDRSLDAVQVTVVLGLEEHAQVVEGNAFETVADPERMNVWVEKQYADKLALQTGEVYRLVDPMRRGTGPVEVRVAGVWEALDVDEHYWYRPPPVNFAQKLLTTEEQSRRYLYPSGGEKLYFNIWYYVLDDSRMNLGRAEHYIDALNEIAREVDERIPQCALDFAPLAELEQGYQRRIGLSTVLFGLSLPLMGLLFYFMVSVSSIVTRYQQQEVATLSSRGTGKLQVLLLTLLEAVIIAALSLPLGIVAGLALAEGIAYARAFLGFGATAPVEMHIASVDWQFVVLGLLVGICSRLAPSWFATRLSIVTYERSVARRTVLPGIMRTALIALLMAATVYSYRRLVGMGSLALVGIEPDDPSFDPLLLLAPSLFLLTAPLVAVEGFTLLVRPLVLVGRFFRSAPGFLGCVSLGREGGQYRTPVYMLVLCLTLGVFFASLAKSADTWLIDRRRYEVGADLAFQPVDVGVLASQGAGIGEITLDRDSKETATYLMAQLESFVLPITDYENLEGVEHATRVAEYEVSLPSSPRLPKGRLMGIDRLDFSQVAYFRSDYAPYSLGESMNRLGSTTEGILLPNALAAELQVSEGDRLAVRVALTEQDSVVLNFVLVGTFDYFPTMYEDESYLLVANLEYLQSQAGGALPWSVWMRLEPEADSEQVMNAVWGLGVAPVYPRDLRARVYADQELLERRGLFGMLTVCFITGAALAGLGLLVYSLASMLGRSFRFSVWQALGLRRFEVVAVVSIEYLVTLVYGIVTGTLGGILASQLYVPIFRLTDSVEVPVPPYLPLVDWNGTALITGGLALVLVVVEAIILVRVARTRVFEVLRMGTRE